MVCTFGLRQLPQFDARCNRLEIKQLENSENRSYTFPNFDVCSYHSLFHTAFA